jgi:hypothetical protein
MKKPQRANSTHTARPMPLLAPVTMASFCPGLSVINPLATLSMNRM